VLDPPPNADSSFVVSANEALTLARDLINTPASDLGPAELAAAARELAGRHGAEVREWVATSCSPAISPPSMRSGAPARRHRA